MATRRKVYELKAGVGAASYALPSGLNLRLDQEDFPVFEVSVPGNDPHLAALAMQDIDALDAWDSVTVASDETTDEDAPADGLNATDAARDLAADHGIDLATITGTGADGRITVDDVKGEINRIGEND